MSLQQAWVVGRVNEKMPHNAPTNVGFNTCRCVLLAQVGMTTNAVTLKPRLQADLRDAGLTAVNISLDTLVAEKFAQITRRSPKILGASSGNEQI